MSRWRSLENASISKSRRSWAYATRRRRPQSTPQTSHAKYTKEATYTAGRHAVPQGQKRQTPSVSRPGKGLPRRRDSTKGADGRDGAPVKATGQASPTPAVTGGQVAGEDSQSPGHAGRALRRPGLPSPATPTQATRHSTARESRRPTATTRPAEDVTKGRPCRGARDGTPTHTSGHGRHVGGKATSGVTGRTGTTNRGSPARSVATPAP